jgi:hypothetical protein
MAVCAYCGCNNQMTREHLFPKGVSALLLDKPEDGHYFLEKSPVHFSNGEPTVKDVCAKCNNEILSQLDSYAVEFLGSQCNRNLKQNEMVILKYDYDLLLRWVLKLMFNSARVHERDVELLQRTRGYIIGNSNRPKRFALYLNLIHSHVLTNEEKDAVFKQTGESNDLLHHELFRNSIVRFNTNIKTEKLARAVMFKSFAFVVLLIHPKAPFETLKQFCSDFLKVAPHAVLINPNNSKVSAEAHLDTVKAMEGHLMHHSDAYFGKPWEQFEQKYIKRNK